MLTNDLQQVWGEWIATAEKLVQKMHEQTVGITLRDFARIHRLQPEIAAMMADLAALESKADSMVRNLGEVMATGTDLVQLAKTLEKVEAQALLSLANRVSAESRAIRGLVEKNSLLMVAKLGTMPVQDAPAAIFPARIAA